MSFKKSIAQWSIGLILTILFIIMSVTGFGDFTAVIEKKTFDLRSKVSASKKRNPDIEIVVIDDEDLDEIGYFPWPRSILAQAVNNLAMAGAKVIALDIILNEPEENSGLNTIRELKKTYVDLDLKKEGSSANSFYQLLNKAEARLDNDTTLAETFKKAGNVVLPIYFDTRSAGKDNKVPDYLAKNSYKIIDRLKNEWATSSMMWLPKIKPLLPSFANSVAGIGHINLFPDDDGSIRKQIHAIGYLDNTVIPSFPIAIVKIFRDIDYGQIRLNLGEEINIKIPTSKTKTPATELNISTLIKWNDGPEIAFHRTPFRKVLKNEFQTSLFRDNIVILGPTASGIGDRFVTPISSNLSGVEIIANSVSNILQEKFITRPQWASYLELGIIILFGIYISFLLPRLKSDTGALITLILLLSYGTAGTLLFFRSNIWLKITPQLVLLILGYIFIVSGKFFITEKTKEKEGTDSVETNKALGLSFQKQGMLDLAFEKFRNCPTDEPGVKDLLYNLGFDYEKKRQFNKALSTYNMIVEDGSNFKDLSERMSKLKGAESAMIFSASASHTSETGTTINSLDTKPTTLGRYEISGEIGRGAMGIVYKGKDPTIHRTVAIKTLRLSDFEEGKLTDIKERFFREAESAGLLTHPNIVTIYDAGEVHDLAYIAMEYLVGENLVQFTHKGKLLPLRNVLNIVIQVADALDYAHKNNIVHRDIKPANIMLLKGTDKIKVTDFGIAKITSSSKTKTGMVLGTPSYMSPEQVIGRGIDGRSDIFSLGIVLFEMLTGQKPFVSEDMTSLLFQITKGEHLSVRKCNPKIPPILEKIINKSLMKDADQRYQKASSIAQHLRKIVEQIDNLKKKRPLKNNRKVIRAQG